MSDPPENGTPDHQMMTQVEHTLKRSNMYIGDIVTSKDTKWIIYDTSSSVDNMILKCEKVDIEYNEGLYQILYELIINSCDHVQRCMGTKTPVTFIKCTLDDTTFTITNDGKGIPLTIDPTHNIYIPEMIFSHLLSSGNYDDTKKRLTGGTNGLGSKVATVFSEVFSIEIVTDGIMYTQFFKVSADDKEIIRSIPVLVPTKSKNYIKISCTPRFSRFKMESFKSNDTSVMIKTAVYNCAAISSKGCKVFLNDKRIPINTFAEYVNTFLLSTLPPPVPDVDGTIHPVELPEIVTYKTDRWDIIATMNPFDAATQIGFVNGLSVNSGSHFNHAWEPVIKQIITDLEGSKKFKDITIKPQMIRDRVLVFVNALIENIGFDSQKKTTLVTKASAFGSECIVPHNIIKKIANLGFMEEMMEAAKLKELSKLNKAGGSGIRKSRIIVPKLEDATQAGTKRSMECMLILTEGDSSKSSAIAGTTVTGRDFIGIFPLRGKVLNVRGATIKQLMENVELLNVTKILGLSPGMKDKKNLRYGRIMLMCDADEDGKHIAGLIMNYFSFFYPEIFEDNFICSLLTPVIKATLRSKKVISFYSMNDYNIFKASPENNEVTGIRYYKGVGSSTSKEAQEYFRDMRKNQISYVYSKKIDEEYLELAFDKKLADDRKKWIAQTIINNEAVDYKILTVPVHRFINTELAQYSIYNVTRSIPNMVDGLKTSQRKIMYGCLMKKLYSKKNEIRVSQLGGYISENVHYHHGEASLYDTIVGMATEYVGSGNGQPLFPSGQFGTRRMNAADSAAPRYIFTYMREWVPLVFSEHDSNQLKHLMEDADKIEPEYYAPIVPMILINGSIGIATGYSTNIPCFNPATIIDTLTELLQAEDEDNVEIKPMIPWYKGFKGIIYQVDTNRFMSRGVFHKEGVDTVVVTEIPVGMSTDTFKEHLEELEKAEHITSFTSNTTEENVYFKIAGLACNNDDILSTLKLESPINTSNMMAFDEKRQIHKYESAEEILWRFYKVRLHFYRLRKEDMIRILEAKLFFLSEKARFIMMVTDEVIKVHKTTKAALIVSIEDHKFVQLAESASSDKVSYNYLLNIPIHLFTADYYEDLLDKVRKMEIELNLVKDKSYKQLWLDDLEALKQSTFLKKLET